MVDQGTMYQIENYLENYTSTWLIDYRVLIMAIIIIVLILGTWLWFRKKKNKKNNVV